MTLSQPARKHFCHRCSEMRDDVEVVRRVVTASGPGWSEYACRRGFDRTGAEGTREAEVPPSSRACEADLAPLYVGAI